MSFAEFELSYTEGDIWQRISKPDLKHEILYKALGIKGGVFPTVLDTTAGWGKDALMMAAFGCEVTLCEKHPQVAEKLQQALHNAKSSEQLAPIVKRMTLKPMCAIEYMHSLTDNRPDVIVCDPMFSHTSSALPKKDMQILRSIQHDTTEEDVFELVKAAIHTATKRVIVKRAKNCAPYYPKPNFTLKARSHHFDIYTPVRTNDEQ